MAIRRSPHLLLVASLAVLFALGGCSSGSSGGSRGDQPTTPGENNGNGNGGNGGDTGDGDDSTGDGTGDGDNNDGGDDGTGNGDNNGGGDDGTGNGDNNGGGDDGTGNGDNNGGGDDGTGNGGDTGGGDDGGGTEEPEPQPTIAAALESALTHTRLIEHDLLLARLNGAHWQTPGYAEPVRPVAGDSPIHPAGSVEVALDAAGNGFTAWARGTEVHVSRYFRDSASWAAPELISNSSELIGEVNLSIDRDTGDAFVAWQQGDGPLQQLYVNRFDAVTSTWGTPYPLQSETRLPHVSVKNLYVAARNGRAAVVWSESDGSAGNVCAGDNDACTVQLARYDAGGWIDSIGVQESAHKGAYPEVALDRDGNVMVIWQWNLPSGEMEIRARRWSTAGGLEPASHFLNDVNGDRHARIAMDGAGNGFVLWRNGGAHVRRFLADGTWLSPRTLSAPDAVFSSGGEAGEIAMDEQGGALALWIQDDGGRSRIYARRYDVATGDWGDVETVEQRPNSANTDTYRPAVATNGERSLIAWMENRTGGNDLAVVSHAADGWQPAFVLDERDERVLDVAAALDDSGNAILVWLQADGVSASVIQALYLTDWYQVAAGDDWQSIAAELYGVDSPEAATALANVMGGGLLEGRRLSGFPPVLSVDTPVVPYYTVQPGDTWAHIAQGVYGSHDDALIEALRQQLGAPALVGGMQINVPVTLAYFPSSQFSAGLAYTLTNTEVVDVHSLQEEALTTSHDEWAASRLLESDNAHAGSPAIAFAADGRGMAVWAQGNDVRVRYYSATLGWSASTTVVSDQSHQPFEPRLAVDPQTGNAVVAWVQSDGTQPSLYASIYNATAGSWTAPHLVETNDDEPVTTSPQVTSVSIRGGNVALAWLQYAIDGRHAFVARFVDGIWSGVEQLDVTGGVGGLGIAVAIDDDANVVALWQQSNAIWGRHWQAGAVTLDAPQLFDGAGRFPKVAFDAAGNAIALWEQGSVWIKRYQPATGWGPTPLQVSVGNAAHAQLVVTGSGRAMAAWGEGDELHAAEIDAGSGVIGAVMMVKDGSVSLAQSANEPIALGFDGEHAVIAWAQQGSEPDMTAARFAEGQWTQASAILDTFNAPISRTAAGLKPNGDAIVLWVQPDGGGRSIFAAESISDPYYLMPSSATWQIVANALYGVDSTAAGTALQLTLPEAELTAGGRLRGMPSTLAVTSSVPRYYEVQSGDTWESIALALYGVTAAEGVTALRFSLGDPSLLAGSRLPVSATLAYQLPVTP